MSVSSQVAEADGQNGAKPIRNNSVRRQVMSLMLTIIVILSMLSFFCVADIRPTGGVIQYINACYPFAFASFIIINFIFIFVFKSAKFLIFVFIGLLFWIGVIASDSVFLSDKIWTNIYMNFDISPGDGSRGKSLKQLLSSKDAENMCGDAAIDRLHYGESADLPLNKLCAFVYRGWLSFFAACSVEIVYIGLEHNNIQDNQNVFKSLMERELKRVGSGAVVNYYSPINSGVLMYKSCYPISIP